MKKIIPFLILILFATQLSAQQVNYALPKTVLVVEVEAVEITEKAGPYVNYSERYLSLKDVIIADKTSWEISKITVKTKAVPDEKKLFNFEMTDKMTVQLTSKGFLQAVNTFMKKTPAKTTRQENKTKAVPTTDFFNNSALTEEQLLANSTAKMAENAAKQIYRIRESRLNLLAGENDNVPADGESLKLMLKNLDKSERALMQLFTGKKHTRKFTQKFEITPTENLSDKIIFHFSDQKGIIEKDDQNGNPVVLNLTKTSLPTPTVTTGTDDKEKNIIYNVPAQAQVEIKMGSEIFVNREIPVAQLGGIAKIPLKSLQKGTQKVIFDAKTGALINIGAK